MTPPDGYRLAWTADDITITPPDQAGPEAADVLDRMLAERTDAWPQVVLDPDA